MSLPSEQYQTAKGLVNRLIQHYGLEQTVEMGYKPATLIHATLVHVASPDTFLRFFLSSMYDVLSPNTPKAVDSDTSIIVVLSYFDDFTSWNSERTENFKRALEYFAEYIVEGLLLPRKQSSWRDILQLEFRLIILIKSELRLIRHHNQHLHHYHPLKSLHPLERRSVYLGFARLAYSVTDTDAWCHENSTGARPKPGFYSMAIPASMTMGPNSSANRAINFGF